MTSNAASTSPAETVVVPSMRGSAPTVVDQTLDDQVADDDQIGQVGQDDGEDLDDVDGQTSQDDQDGRDTAGPEDLEPDDDVAEPDAAAEPATTEPPAEPATAGPAVEPAPVEPAPVELGPDPAGLHGRAVEARDRLRPEGPVIPAPRSPQGVMVPPEFGRRGDQPSAEVTAALEELVADLAAVRAEPDEPAHHALVRIGEHVTGAIPDAGWSRVADLDPDVVAEAAELAAELHTAAAAVLERLDADGLVSPAVVIDSVATSLQVMRMVADLEVFARSRV